MGATSGICNHHAAAFKTFRGLFITSKVLHTWCSDEQRDSNATFEERYFESTSACRVTISPLSEEQLS